LNGVDLKLGANDALPDLTGAKTPAGKIVFAPTSITFLELPTANNASCQP
jgi:heparanase